MTGNRMTAYDTPSAAARWASGGATPPELRALAVIPDGARVLDVGGGGGRIAAALEARGCLVTAADQAFAMARESGGVQAGAGQLPFPDHAFDAVAMIRLLHLLPKPERLKALQEALRVVKPGGFLALTVLCPPPVPPLAGAYAPLPVRKALRGLFLAVVVASNGITDVLRRAGLGLEPRAMSNPSGERAFFHHFTPGGLADELVMAGWAGLKVAVDPPLPGGWRGRLPFPGLEMRTLAVAARKALA